MPTFSFALLKAYREFSKDLVVPWKKTHRCPGPSGDWAPGILCLTLVHAASSSVGIHLLPGGCSCLSGGSSNLIPIILCILSVAQVLEVSVCPVTSVLWGS